LRFKIFVITMQRPEAIFLGVWFPGLFLLIFGTYLTRRHWRSDILPYPYQSRCVRACDVVLHPGRYASPNAARAARIFNLVGALLLAVGLVAILYGILHAMQSR
jgi:hypothetical protein